MLTYAMPKMRELVVISRTIGSFPFVLLKPSKSKTSRTTILRSWRWEFRFGLHRKKHRWKGKKNTCKSYKQNVNTNDRKNNEKPKWERRHDPTPDRSRWSQSRVSCGLCRDQCRFDMPFKATQLSTENTRTHSDETQPNHDDVIKRKHFPRYWPFVRGIHRWIPFTKPSDAELWCFLWYAPWINGWVNNREAGDLRHHRADYDVSVVIEGVSICMLTREGPHVKFNEYCDSAIKVNAC